ncbi:MAG: hypothetical protein HGA82_03415 [Anaerolineales bacterium]|nr:hypothetical protein [Anaerolineales bacterium]
MLNALLYAPDPQKNRHGEGHSGILDPSSGLDHLRIGGVETSVQHAWDTAAILTEIDPDYVGALTLMLVPGTPLHEDYTHGRFVLPDTFGFLRELLLIVRHSAFTHCYFTSNHASNYLPVQAHLPLEKDRTVQMIKRVLEKKNPETLRPEFLRAL